MKKIITFFLLFIGFYSMAQKASIQGQVSDQMGPMPDVNIFIKGTSKGTVSDFDGNFTISVEPGSYTLVVSYTGYQNIEIPVDVNSGQVKIINPLLKSKELDTVVFEHVKDKTSINATKLETVQKQEIVQSIGIEELEVKNASTVADGVTKMTGVSKVESRGLFVRGLEERYNNLLINGLQIPSNNPFNKMVALDKFPTDVVGKMDVYKTFNANLYGDFAGATIDINTTEVGNNKTKISFGTGFNTNNTNELISSVDMINSKGYLGMKGSDYSLPASFGSMASGTTLSKDASLKAFNTSWDVAKISTPINTSFGFFTNQSKRFGKDDDYRLGFILSLNFDNSYSYKEGVDRAFSGGVGSNAIYVNDLQKSQTNLTTSTSALAAINFKSDRLNLTFNNIYIKTTNNTIKDQIGLLDQFDQQFVRLNQYEQSDFNTAQLIGNYDFDQDQINTLSFGSSFTNVLYQQPDRKAIKGQYINDQQIEYRFGGDNLIRQFLDSSGQYFLSNNLTFKHKFGQNQSHYFTIGYNGYNQYSISDYRFIFGLAQNGIPPAAVLNVNEINSFINNNIENGSIVYFEGSTDDYRTRFDQNTHAGFASLFYQLTEAIELTFGTRYELVNRKIDYRLIGDGFQSLYRTKDDAPNYLLPSLNVKYELDRLNLRFAASKTITKPVQMEVMPIQYVSPDGNVIIGNPDLKNSENLNVALKAEYLTEKMELFSVTVFGKQIDNPIETIFNATAGGSTGLVKSFANSNSATVYGIEFEGSIELDRVNNQLKGLSAGFNTSLMNTSVESTNNQETHNDRALQGAANWMLNADLRYQAAFNQDWNNTFSLVYAVTGERIETVGVAGLDHIYEKPFSKLDFVWKSNFNDSFSAKLAVSNILNPYYRVELGSNSTIDVVESDLAVNKFKRGTGISLGFSYNF